MISVLLWEDRNQRVAAYWHKDQPTWRVVVDGRDVSPRGGYTRRRGAIDAARQRTKTLRKPGDEHDGPCDASCFGHFDN